LLAGTLASMLIIILLIRKRPLPYYFFIVEYLILALSSVLLYAMYQGLYVRLPHLHLLISPFHYLIGPACYFFVLTSCKPFRKFTKLDLIHLIPFVLHLLDLLPFYMLSGEEKLAIFQADYASNFIHAKSGLFLLYFEQLFLKDLLIFGYTTASLWLINRTYRKAMESLRQNNLVLYRWVHIDVVLKIIVGLAGMARGLWPENYPIVDMVFASTIILDLTVGTFFILLHPKILEGLQPATISFEPLFQSEAEIKEPDETPQDHLPVTDQAEIQPPTQLSTEHLKLIETFFQSNKPFLKDEFSREQLSRELKLGLRQITQAIKSGTNLNFSEYVNGYRIRHLEEQYKHHPEWRNFTIDAVGEQIGFTSRMSFYNATRKHRNLTPSELLKHLRSE